MSVDSSISAYYKRLTEIISSLQEDIELFEGIVNAPFCDKLHATNFDLGMIVLVLVNKKDQLLDRVAYSKTSPAIDAVKASPKEFSKIRIPLDYTANTTVSAILSNKPQQTSDWAQLLSPVLSKDAARFNQAEAGMDCSYVYPLESARDGGALIYSFYQAPSEIGATHKNFMERYTSLVSQRLSV